MNTKQKIEFLWTTFQAAINSSYSQSRQFTISDQTALRDYATDMAFEDKLETLLAKTRDEERHHRRFRDHAVKGFSIDSAAKLLLMHAAKDGAESRSSLSAVKMLTVRHTALEAEVLGYLAKTFLGHTWRAEVTALDYAKLMHG
jgi:hypothetical protein